MKSFSQKTLAFFNLEVGVADAGSGIENVFDEITALASECKFADCAHTTEPGCAIQKAIAENRLDEGKFQNYLKLKKVENVEKSEILKNNYIK